MTLQTTVPDNAEREHALLAAIGLDKLSVPQRELAISIAERYDLDLLLKHLVMIEGRAYITRDGLLHVAHKSGDFDGIEASDPTKGDDGYWRSTCSVYRKSFGRPFTYTGRYPSTGGNAKYAPEMAIKVGEVMALRRAFDVSAPAYEERWTENETETETEMPATLADRVAAKVATIDVTPVEPVGDVKPGPTAKPGTFAGVEPVPETSPVVALEPTETGATVEADVSPTPEPGLTLETFAAAIISYQRDEVRAVAKAVFPDVKKFSSLNDAQRLRLLEQVQSDLHPTVTGTLCEVRSPTQAPCDLVPGEHVLHRAAAGAESW